MPGLPLTLLDRNLIHGNALIGLSSFDEIRKIMERSNETLFEVNTEQIIQTLSKPQ